MSWSPGSSLRRLNRTELYQVCLNSGVKVHPSTNREDLIKILIGDVEPTELDEATHPTDSWRRGIIGFLTDHWASLETQIKCPAKNLKHPINPNPNPCFGCLDTQVITCVVRNRGRVEKLIEAHRPPKKEKE